MKKIYTILILFFAHTNIFCACSDCPHEDTELYELFEKNHPIIMAILLNDTKTIEFELQKDKSIVHKLKQSLPGTNDNYAYSILNFALSPIEFEPTAKKVLFLHESLIFKYWPKRETIQLIISANPDIDKIEGKLGYSPLHRAVNLICSKSNEISENGLKIFELLINAGAIINCKKHELDFTVSEYIEWRLRYNLISMKLEEPQIERLKKAQTIALKDGFVQT